MKLFLPVHQADPGGIMTVTSGLVTALPAALDPADELVLYGDPAAARWSSVQRILDQQWGAARAAEGADLVHLGDYRPIVASRVPFVVTIHDLVFLDSPQWYPRAIALYKRAMLRVALAKRPAALVCVSEHSRQRLLHHAPGLDPRRARVIHPGLATPPAAPAPSARGRSSPPPEGGESTGGAPYFLTVGAIQPRRNHLTLLRAFLRARAQGLPLRWIVVGRVHYAGDAIHAALRAAPGVQLRGWVSDDELERLYRGARLVALPSYAEGFGLVPLEAMARGVPTVVATGGALDESAGDAAVRVDPDDVAGWADALARVNSDEGLRATLIVKGRKRAASFTWERAAREHVALFRALVAQ